MKLRSEQLKKRAAEAGVSVEQLAEAVSRDGLKGDRAGSAVRNWMAGRDHPRARRQDVERLSEVLGVLPKDIVRFTSEVRHNRGSEKKVKLVTDSRVDKGTNIKRFQPKDRGRAHQILKRTSHITIGVEERG